MAVNEMSASLSPFPLFYRQPVTVDPARLGTAGLPGRRDLAFAKTTNSIPVVLGELAEVARSYPILFTEEEHPVPIALVGLVGDDNLFVNPSPADPAVSVWADGLYVPGYVRRYPFILMDTPSADRFVVCADAEGLAAEGDEAAVPLFDGEGKPSTVLQQGAEFCRLYHAAHTRTRDWVDALQAADLLTAHQVNISVNDGKPYTFSGFQVINAEKFDALPDDTFLEWRRNGWLAPIYQHQASLLNWDRLIGLTFQPAVGGPAIG